MNVHILIVDDDVDLGDTVAELLETRGFRVTRTTSAVQALERLDAVPPDIILLDYMMPEMSGLDFRLAQRARPAARHIPVVLFTAARDSPELEAIEPAAHLRKPCTLAEIVETIDRVCAGGNSSR